VQVVFALRLDLGGVVLVVRRQRLGGRLALGVEAQRGQHTLGELHDLGLGDFHVCGVLRVSRDNKKPSAGVVREKASKKKVRRKCG
jgi:hypothetical protein